MKLTLFRWRTWRRLLLGVVILWCAVVFLLWWLQRPILFWGAQASRPWGSFSLQLPHVDLRGWVIHPQGKRALIIFGGNNLAVAPLAEWSACTSSAIYLVPYRGYEGQAGQPSEHALVSDGVAVVDAVRKKHPEVDVLGISLGTGVAAQVAARVAVERVLLIEPYDRMTHVVNDHFWFWPASLLLDDTFDNIQALRKVRAPVAIVRARDDQVVLPERTDALLAALPSSVQVLTLPTTHEGMKDRPELCPWLRAQTDGRDDQDKKWGLTVDRWENATVFGWMAPYFPKRSTPTS